MANRALEGIKVADFSWVGVGPLSAKYLADHGATVVRIESITHIDPLRNGGPFAGNTPGINRSGYYADFNSSKYGVALNLNHPKARGVALRFAQWADIVTESFTPRAMRKWRLTYEDLRKVNPQLIMISMPMFGQTGPYQEFRGYGHSLQGIVGVNHLTGYPDGIPAGTAGAYTDFFAYNFAAIAMLCALEYRRRTGKGQYIDLAQYETSTNCLETGILDYTINGRVQERVGNKLVVGDEIVAAPHDAYPCRGEDRWCAIAVFTETEWRNLCEVMGNPEWSREEQFSSLEGRIANMDDLDRLISLWTEEQEAEDVMSKLQAVGVPAGVVQNGAGLHSDPQLKHRGHFWRLDHPEMGNCAYTSWSFRLSKTPAELRSPAPLLGEHNEYVYKEFLGMTEDEFIDLLVDGVFE